MTPNKTFYHFTCRGHPNITAKHHTTIEVTKDDAVSVRGDCIAGVCADFDSIALQQFLEGAQDIEITFSCRPPLGTVDKTESIPAKYNPSFKADREVVIRRGPYASERTLATHAQRACVDFSREFVEMIKNPSAIISVIIRKL